MADFYPYLIASLPMLHFGMKPPFSFERFLEVCRPFTPERDYHVILTLPQSQQYPQSGEKNLFVRRWVAFDTALRNELVRVRAAKKHVDPAAYLRPAEYEGPSLAPSVLAAGAHPSILDAEKTLDETRWDALNELVTGHYFDLDVLITYAYQLLILERWENIRNADGKTLLSQLLPD
jgi:hypothetical protein